PKDSINKLNLKLYKNYISKLAFLKYLKVNKLFNLEDKY
ncbi:hypothetical protein FOXB_03515, partial [Fusarium oxysporum f. sp. conglutinans Fo5176]